MYARRSVHSALCVGSFVGPGVSCQYLPRRSRWDLRLSFSNYYMFLFGELGIRSASVIFLIL